MNSLNVFGRARTWATSALLLAALAGCGGGGGGGGGDTPAANAAPVPVLTLSGLIESGSVGADATAFAGSDLVLSARGSTDAEGDALSYQWSVVSQPLGSNLTLQGGITQSVRPAVVGLYEFKLAVSDARGANAAKNVRVLVDASAVSATSVIIRPTFTVEPIAQPTQSLAIGAAIVLYTGSFEPQGNGIQVEWALIDKPGASKATLVSAYVSRLVVDAAGVYKLRARGINPHSAFSDTVYVFEVNHRVPKTLLAGVSGQSTVAANGGSVLLMSGPASTSLDGAPPSYAWSLASKPAASAANVAGSGSCWMSWMFRC